MTEVTSNPLVFTDSNIWLYALITGQDPAKSQVAGQLIAHNTAQLILSNQVVIEVVANLIKKSNLNEDNFQQFIISAYHDYRVISVDEAIMSRASHLRVQYAISYWDSLIIAAALQAGASTLYTEDMQNGQVIDNQLTIVNPFI